MDGNGTTFERAERKGRRGIIDEPGEVRILVQRVAKGKPERGNVSRVIRVRSARVTQVAAYLEDSLFGEPSSEN